MYGFEFSDKAIYHQFPSYNIDEAVSVESISKISPLVWQEHCVECAMPACYGTCVHYRKRSDGRCKLFKNGIERVVNKDALLCQNAIIEIDEWGKLETFFFTSGISYDKAKRINNRLVSIAKVGQTLRLGVIRRLCYYAKEYYIRKIGDRNTDIPRFFLCEIMNDSHPYVLVLENRAKGKIVFRKNLTVKNGYNRFLFPSADLRFQSGCRNYLLIYPDGNKEQLVNLISLELVTFKDNYLERYLPASDKKVKCVVWDLDNTVWEGILADDGIDGVKLKANVVDIIKSLDAKGIINSIASKNDEKLALEAIKAFGIDQYFVCSMINWNPKSQNIKSIVSALDIGMDTFVFVDDSFFELNEVKENCFGIRVCDAKDIDEYVHRDCFDVPVTEESKRRRESYKEIAVRNKAQLENADNNIGFLKQCNMIVQVAEPGQDELIRCYELLQRTNQLNISGERLTLEEVKHFVEADDHECYRIKVHDRYGDYGLVGFAVFDVASEETAILQHFVFSCRAARKLIEQNFFKYVIEKYKALGYKKLVLNCKITEKNELMRQVLDESQLFKKMNQTPNHYELIHDMSDPIKTDYIMTIKCE